MPLDLNQIRKMKNMKTTVKQLAAATFIAFLFLVGSVKAEATEIKASHRKNIESTLKLEKWMTDETFWEIKSATIAEFNQETEADQELEDWMTNAEIWNSADSVDQEVEPGLELEGWMMNGTTWNTDNMKNESVFVVEPWMLDNNYWK